jgi:hypothetical protein
MLYALGRITEKTDFLIFPLYFSVSTAAGTEPLTRIMSRWLYPCAVTPGPEIRTYLLERNSVVLRMPRYVDFLGQMSQNFLRPQLT